MLPHETTMRLIARAQAGDDAAAEELTRENMALVKSVARRFFERGVEREDVLQIGCMGLVKAIRRFDLTYQVRFSTYAVPMIAGEIKRYLRDDGQVRVPRTAKELAARALGMREQMQSETGEQPGVQEIAARIGAEPEDVAAALAAMQPAVSLSEPAGDDDARTKGDCIADAPQEERTVDRLLLSALMAGLDEREKRIILLRYFRGCTQSSVAAMIGVSQVQVSRLENRILRKLREAAGEATL